MLVTGGCGFIGTNFIRYLLEDAGFGGRIVNADKLSYAGNPENVKDIGEKFPDQYVFIRADICNHQIMSEVFSNYEIDTVCHFAAESHVDRSISSPADFIRTNIDGTFVLLEVARANQDRLVLFHHVSTDEVFGSLGESGSFTEETPYRPNNPYSASKAASDHLVRAYHTTYGLPITISNCSNNYGPYQFPEKMIPLMILNAVEGKPLPVYGDGRNIRDWLFVRDHCAAVWRIMQKSEIGETYNIGGNNEYQNIDLVECICDIIDENMEKLGRRPRRELITFVKDRPGHDRRYAINSSKLKNELNWQPEEIFESGIRRTILWYLDNRPWVDRVISGDYRNWIESHYG